MNLSQQKETWVDEHPHLFVFLVLLSIVNIILIIIDWGRYL